MLFRDMLMIAASAPSGGAVATYASWPSLVGAEMMVNGDCSSGTGWSLPVGAAIAGGKLTLTTLSDVVENTGIATTLIDGATYRCAFTIDTAAAGAINWSLGNTSGTSRTSPGTYSQDLLADATDTGNLNATSATMQLDNFSVKSVGLLGVEADWAFSAGDVYWVTPPAGVNFDGAVTGSKAELTGSAKTAFDAAVSNTTATTTVLYADGNGLLGTVQVVMKGGTVVNYVFDGTLNQSVSHTVTSGAGSGFELIAGGDTPAGCLLRVTIALA